MLKIILILQKFAAKISWQMDRQQQTIFYRECGPVGLVLQLIAYLRAKIGVKNRIKMYEVFLYLSPTPPHAFLIICSCFLFLFFKKKMNDFQPVDC